MHETWISQHDFDDTSTTPPVLNPNRIDGLSLEAHDIDNGWSRRDYRINRSTTKNLTLEPIDEGMVGSRDEARQQSPWDNLLTEPANAAP